MYSRYISISIENKIKSMGIIWIIMPFITVLMADEYNVSGTDIGSYIKILLSIIFFIGIYHLLIVSTPFFKVKPIDKVLNKTLNTRSIEVSQIEFADHILFLNKKKELKYPKREIAFLEFKPLIELVRIVNDSKLFEEDLKGDVLSLISTGHIVNKIHIKYKNEKNVQEFKPIFDFLNDIIDGGIYAFYGRSRKIFFDFIIENFTENNKNIKYDNLRKRYQEWLGKHKSESDNLFTLK